MAEEFNAATEKLSATVFVLAIDKAVAHGEDPGSDHIVIMRRFGAAMVAAEKMADAIEAAEDSRYSMTDAAKAAWEFRKAMRGEL